MKYIKPFPKIKASGRLNNACVIIMRTHAAVHRLASDRRAPRVLAGGAQTSGAKAQVVPLSSGQHALVCMPTAPGIDAEIWADGDGVVG